MLTMLRNENNAQLGNSATKRPKLQLKAKYPRLVTCRTAIAKLDRGQKLIERQGCENASKIIAFPSFLRVLLLERTPVSDLMLSSAQLQDSTWNLDSKSKLKSHFSPKKKPRVPLTWIFLNPDS